MVPVACECKAGVGPGLCKFNGQPGAGDATSHLGGPAARCGRATVGTISATMPKRALAEDAFSHVRSLGAG